MQSLIIFVLFLAFISQCLCHEWNVGTRNEVYNVLNFGAKGDGRTDDSQAFVKAFHSACGAKGTASLVIPSDYVFFVSTITLKGPCSSSLQIQIQGKIVALGKNAFGAYRYTWILITNIDGLVVSGDGVLDGSGSTWWSCISCPRPSVITFNSCNRLSVTYLSIVNSPKAHLNINNCQGATFSHINVRAPASSPNTDGIDISDSRNIIISYFNIACGDDCIAIGGSSSYINISEVACGPGHGISVGSLGRNSETVQDVYVRNCSFTGTTNGARIKTIQSGSGYARRITFEQITLKQARNPIVINNFYNGENNGVNVSGVTFRGFRGTCTYDNAINLNCGPTGCFDIVLDQNNIVSSQPGKELICTCNNAHGTATDIVPTCPCLKP